MLLGHHAQPDVLRTKHENMETAYETWESLHSMFGRQSDQCRHEATKAYLTTKMRKGVSVREHVLNMINLIHEAEIHGATVDEKTQVSVILESLTPAFIPFTTNYIMNKLEYNLTQLLNELQTFETISKQGPKRVRQMLPNEGHLLLLVGPTKRRKDR